MSQTIFSVEIHVDRVTVVRSHRDTVYFHVSAIDSFGRPSRCEVLHGDHEKLNDRDLSISTVVGNGPALARLLGWPGKITVIGRGGIHCHVPARCDQELPGLGE